MANWDSSKTKNKEWSFWIEAIVNEDDYEDKDAWKRANQRTKKTASSRTILYAVRLVTIQIERIRG